MIFSITFENGAKKVFRKVLCTFHALKQWLQGNNNPSWECLNSLEIEPKLVASLLNRIFSKWCDVCVWYFFHCSLTYWQEQLKDHRINRP